MPVHIIFFAYAVLLLAQWPAAYLIQNVSITLGVLLNEWLIVAGLPVGLARHWKIPFSTLFPFKKPLFRDFFWTVCMTLSLAVLIDDLTFLSEKIWAPSPKVQNLLDWLMTVESPFDGTWRFFLICLTPAFCEELFFRGLFQNTLAARWGGRKALWITAAAFALIHGIPQYWHLYFLLGFYLGWLLWVRQNLWLPMLAHLVNNAWTYLTHVLGLSIPAGDMWVPTDSLVMGICVIVFFLCARRFSRG